MLAAYKYRPSLEHRHAELKSPVDVAPVFLKDAARIEGLLCPEFLALLVRVLIEREIRQAMERRQLAELSLYPEGRGCRAPTATRVLAIFAGLARHASSPPTKWPRPSRPSSVLCHARCSTCSASPRPPTPRD